MNIKLAVENAFERWSEIVVSHRWPVLLITLLFTIATAPLIKNGWLDVSVESFLPKDDPVIVRYDDFRRSFNTTPGSTIAIHFKDGAFTLKNLETLRAIHKDLEENVLHVKDVTSLYNVRYSRGDGDYLRIDELHELWPTTEADIPAFRELVLSNPNYIGKLISADGSMVNIVVNPQVFAQGDVTPGTEDIDELFAGFDDNVIGEGNQDSMALFSPKDEVDFAKSIMAVGERHRSDHYTLYDVGGPTMNLQLSQDIQEVTTKTSLMGFGIIIVLLAVLFRRLSGVLIPLLVVILSLLITLALWPTLGYAFNANTQIIPTFILAVGIADAVHILSIFYRYYDNGMDKHEAIVLSMKKTAIAVLMTSITTAAGLLSFLSSEMIPIKTIGIFGAIGVMFALFYTLSFVPCILAILPIKRKAHNGQERASVLLDKIDALIRFLGDFSVRHAKGIIVVTSVIAIVSLTGISKIRFDHDPVSWYPLESDFRQGFALQDSMMDGTINYQLVVYFNKENALQDPAVLRCIEDIETTIKQYRFKNTQATEVISLLSVVKETHQSLNQNDPGYFIIPDDQPTVAQELLLFENSESDDILDYSDSTFSTARINVIAPWGNILDYRDYLSGLEAAVQNTIAKHGMTDAQFAFTGLLPIFARTTYAMLQGTVYSYLLAFVLVALLMIPLMGDVRRGLLAFSPNITPILITLGLMGWMGIPINIFTSLLGCIVIGISVDDTIHFMHHFRKYANDIHDPREIVKRSLDTCGRAIVFTSIVLIGGFIVHITGMLSINKQFGFLLSLSILIALLANLLIAPAMMTLYWNKKSSLDNLEKS
ncbi:MAG TPA: efflux RND transporter permease subunit [Pseudomonadales bacterium]